MSEFVNSSVSEVIVKLGKVKWPVHKNTAINRDLVCSARISSVTKDVPTLCPANDGSFRFVGDNVTLPAIIMLLVGGAEVEWAYTTTKLAEFDFNRLFNPKGQSLCHIEDASCLVKKLDE